MTDNETPVIMPTALFIEFLRLYETAYLAMKWSGSMKAMRAVWIAAHSVSLSDATVTIDAATARYMYHLAIDPEF